MATFVILNFEDLDAGYGGGAFAPNISRKKKTSSPAVIPGNVTSSAGDTIRGVINKAKSKESYFGKNSVHHYSCIEIINADIAGTLTRDDLANVRKDIASAAKVYIIMHGQPDNTEAGFGHGGAQVATWKQLGRLALMLFPNSDVTYKISLIMCYAARTDNFRINHVGQMTPGDLKTSFAYKFFRSIAVSRNVSMTACTGAVSTKPGDGTNEVESEEFVSAQLANIDYKKDAPNRNILKDQMARLKASFILQGGTKEQWTQMHQDFGMDRAKVPTNDYERSVKTYLSKTAHIQGDIQEAKAAAAALYGNQSNVSKYGRILYTYNGNLTIINKYGNPQDPNVGPDYVLYTGPMLY